MKRRDFLTTTALGSIAIGLEAQATTKKQDGHAQETVKEASAVGGPPSKPVMVSSANGWDGMDKGYQMLLDGGDTLDAAIAVGKVQEDNPTRLAKSRRTIPTT